MGYYIQTPENLFKADQLEILHGAKRFTFGQSMVESFNNLPEDKALICVVNNGPFEAAGLCFSEDEFKAFEYSIPFLFLQFVEVNYFLEYILSVY